MKSEMVSRLGDLFDRWKHEHEELNVLVDALVDWTSEDRSGQALEGNVAVVAIKLRELNNRLQLHFAKEAELGTLLAEAKGHSSVEVESASRRAEGDHRHLAARLDDLIAKVESHYFRNWPDVSREISLFVDALEQHECQESESVGWLMPRAESIQVRDRR